MNIRQIKKLLICAIALHSFVLGTALLVNPKWVLGLSGWNYNGPSFFPAQSGIFLLILAGAYLAGLWYRAFAWFLVASKATAVVFLIAEYIIGAAPRLVLLAAFFDGLMGVVVAIALIWEVYSISNRSV